MLLGFSAVGLRFSYCGRGKSRVLGGGVYVRILYEGVGP